MYKHDNSRDANENQKYSKTDEGCVTMRRSPIAGSSIGEVEKGLQRTVVVNGLLVKDTNWEKNDATTNKEHQTREYNTREPVAFFFFDLLCGQLSTLF
jgi:hypothetical protein